mmetsp:Transcript_17664/g.32344  ORF Transcript_17664/g.32344 Transcript_17664/m.32344 type:complete len:308 (-) Transcript_17664:474-1397(-)
MDAAVHAGDGREVDDSEIAREARIVHNLASAAGVDSNDPTVPQIQNIASILKLILVADRNDGEALLLHEAREFHALADEGIRTVVLTDVLINETALGTVLTHDVGQHDAAVIAEEGEYAIQVHAILVLIKVVPDNTEPATAQKILFHELLGGGEVGSEANAEESEIRAHGEEIAALEIAGGGDFANHIESELGEAETHHLDFTSALRTAKAAHDNAATSGDLLVPSVNKVGKRLKSIRSGKASVSVARFKADRGINHNSINKLSAAHMLNNFALIFVRKIITIAVIDILNNILISKLILHGGKSKIF